MNATLGLLVLQALPYVGLGVWMLAALVPREERGEITTDPDAEAQMDAEWRALVEHERRNAELAHARAVADHYNEREGQ